MKPGDSVYWWSFATGSRTGRFVRIVKRGRNRGLIRIEPTGGIPRKKVFIKAEFVEPIKPPAASIRPKTQLSLSY